MEEKKLSKESTVDSKYIQQHLANERTYLAWIRTAIAIIGVGFLVTNLHYTMSNSFSYMGDMLANLIGILSVVLGIVTIVTATFDYLRKIKAINNQTFVASKNILVILSIFIIGIVLVCAFYFFMNVY